MWMTSLIGSVILSTGLFQIDEGVGGQENEPARDRIDGLVRSAFETGVYPSLSVGIVREDKLVHTIAMGVADKATGRVATVDTVYEIGSVGKVLTTTVLGRLRDQEVVRIHSLAP